MRAVMAREIVLSYPQGMTHKAADGLDGDVDGELSLASTLVGFLNSEALCFFHSTGLLFQFEANA